MNKIASEGFLSASLAVGAAPSLHTHRHGAHTTPCVLIVCLSPSFDLITVSDAREEQELENKLNVAQQQAICSIYKRDSRERERERAGRSLVLFCERICLCVVINRLKVRTRGWSAKGAEKRASGCESGDSSDRDTE